MFIAFTAYNYTVHKAPNGNDVDWSADLCTPHGLDLAVLDNPHKQLDMMRQIRSVKITQKYTIFLCPLQRNITRYKIITTQGH